MIFELIFSPMLDTVLWLVLGSSMVFVSFFFTNVPNMFFIGMYSAIALHLGLLIHRWFSRIEGPNIKLLVLRVFGSSKSAEFTFDKLKKFWRKFGLHFTIDDPDYAEHRYRLFQFKYLVVLIPYVGGLLFIAILIHDWLELFKRRPVQDQERAHQRIRKMLVRPRDINGNFKDLRMAAYMNTWKLVVDEFVKVADVVLFDLREYTEKRKAAQYEVDFIFDTYPANRIIFLRDIASDKEAIQQLILDRWAELREGSPNLDTLEPVVKEYVSNTQKEHDVQGLMDLLFSAAQEEVSVPPL